jgi:hypothetical protein
LITLTQLLLYYVLFFYFRELAFFFPDLNQRPPETIARRTLALIRPSALAQYKDAIIQKIKESGFEIAIAKTVQLDQTQAEEFYAEHKNKAFFNDLVKEMTR